MMRAETHIRQVVVAFGASQVPREMLEAAADLAAALHAEVRALMVEESWLEQVAEHPVTAELYLGSRTIQPWDRDRLRLELRARAEQMRRTVRQLAETTRREDLVRGGAGRGAGGARAGARRRDPQHRGRLRDGRRSRRRRELAWRRSRRCGAHAASR